MNWTYVLWHPGSCVYVHVAYVWCISVVCFLVLAVHKFPIADYLQRATQYIALYILLKVRVERAGRWPLSEKFTTNTKFSLYSLCHIIRNDHYKKVTKRTRIAALSGSTVMSHHTTFPLQWTSMADIYQEMPVRRPHFLYTPDTRHQSEWIGRRQEAGKEITCWNLIYITCGLCMKHMEWAVLNVISRQTGFRYHPRSFLVVLVN